MLYINDRLDELCIEDELHNLSPSRLKHTLEIRHEPTKRQSIAAWLLLRKALHEEYGINSVPEFSFGEHGKPFFSTLPHVHFNMSHCKMAAVCVVDEEEIGVDVECIRNYEKNLAEYVLNDEELELCMKSGNPAKQFIRFWTMKEATLKLTGEGINDDIKHAIRKDIDYWIEEHEGYTICIAKYAK